MRHRASPRREPKRPLRGLAVLALGLSIGASARPLRGQDAAAKPDDRAGRLAEMAREVRSFAAFREGGGVRERVELRPVPLHRWNDPTRPVGDGSIWVWGTSGRPVAAVAIELYPSSRPLSPGGALRQSDHSWAFEFVSLSTGPIEVEGGEGFEMSWDDLPPPRRDGQLRWMPRTPGIEFRDVPGAAAPSWTGAGRLRQMKDLLKRFTAHEFYGPADQRHELRPLPRPIDRYADEGSGLVDGAIFLFANGTNPEVMVLIEAQGPAPSKAAWRFAAARLSRARSGVCIDGDEVRTEPFARMQRPDDCYFLARKLRKPSS